MSRARTVWRNTAVQVAGEILGKLASLAFYVVMARELGQAGFGDFTFALALALLLTNFAGFGTDGIVAREVALERERVHDLFSHALLIKLGLGAVAIVAAVGIALVGSYDAVVIAAVAILGGAAVVELITKSAFAVFQGHDDLESMARALLLQRAVTAAIGVSALLVGAGVVAVAVIYLGGALVAQGWAFRRMLVRVVRPRLIVDRERMRALLRESLPLGITALLGMTLFRIDTVILSLIKGNAAVGVYGTAYRLLESTLFLSFAFVAALLPQLSRLSRETTPSVSEAYAIAVKVILVALAPIGAAFAIFAEPIVETIYGDEYAASVTALRLLGGAATLYGLSYLSSYVLIAQREQKAIPWVTGIVLIQNVVLNLVFIPQHSYKAAAALTSISQASLVLGLMVIALRSTGTFSPLRVLLAPVAGCTAIGAVALAAGTDLPALVAAMAAYAATVAAVERIAFPDDLRRLLGTVRRRPLTAAEATEGPGG